MTRGHARLVVLGGPDGGREILLDRFPVRIGRSGGCEITLAEEFISREHLALSLTADGVVCEVLSDAGLRIAGKKHKKGRRLLLGTGDVLKPGVETEILFVDVGDDTRAALAEAQAARQAAAEARRTRAAAKPPAAPSVQDEPAAAPAEAEGEPAKAAPAAAPLSPAEAAEGDRSRRTRRILIGLGVYVAVLAVGAMMIAMFRNGSKADDGGGDRPAVLSREQIGEMLETTPVLPLNSQEAQAALAEARQLFASRHINRGDAYRCVKLYLRYKALSGEIGFKPIDQKNYRTALREDLLPELVVLYDNAVLAMKQGRWHAAKEDLDAVHKIVPIQSDPIHHNVARHLRYVKNRIRRAKKRPRKGPLG